VISPGDAIAFSPATIRVRITHETPDALIRYTRDGSDPTEQSEPYTGPFTFDTSAVIRARAFRAGFLPSDIASATCSVLPRDFRGIVRAGERVYAFHLASHRPVSLKFPYHSKYPASGSGAVTDGILGRDSYDVDWQGFEQVDLEATIDLGSVTTVASVRSGFLQDQRSWIFFPLNVEVSVSTDGRGFVPLAPLERRETPGQAGLTRCDYVYGGESVSARFVRVRAKNQGYCPPGHPGAGGKAWLFVDEIIVE
jgi:hexosaminidase